MARKSKQDLAKAKEAKQKKILIVGAVLLVVIGAIQVPRTMKMLNQKPTPPIASATATTPTTTDASATPTDPNSLAAPTLAGAAPTATPAAPAASSSASLVSAVPVSADAGQLQSFERFATKDPFAQQAPAGSPSVGGSSSSSSGPGSGSGSGSGGGSGSGVTVTTTPPSTPPPTTGSGSSPTPKVTSAVISVNGEIGAVSVGSDFPTAGTVFSRVGAIFHLVSATAKTAKIAIAGGSYANGARTIPLAVGKPVTLQNTADGTKYTLILEPQGTAVSAPGPTTGTGTTPAATTPTSTTPAGSTPVVPSGNG